MNAGAGTPSGSIGIIAGGSCVGEYGEREALNSSDILYCFT